MHEKDGFKAKWTKFSEDKGFIAILMLCIAAIGISGYVLFFLPAEETADAYDIGLGESLPSAADTTVPDSSMPQIPDVTVQLEPEPRPEPVPVQPETSVDAPVDIYVPLEGQEEAAETWLFKKKPTYRYPVSGEVIRTYSVDALQYDETMGDWRTHNGTDYSCTQGDTVFCLRDGKVLDVYEDGLMGYTVTVEHADGIISCYMGLSSVQVVKKGDTLRMGDEVGTAGGTAIAESSQPYHVHVSVTQYGKYIDVMNLF